MVELELNMNQVSGVKGICYLSYVLLEMTSRNEVKCSCRTEIGRTSQEEKGIDS